MASRWFPINQNFLRMLDNPGWMEGEPLPAILHHYFYW